MKRVPDNVNIDFYYCFQCSFFICKAHTKRSRRKMTPSMLEVTRKSRPGKVSSELFQRRSSTGTKARGMRACRRATKVFSFPSSDGSTIRAIMILQMGGTAPEEKDVSIHVSNLHLLGSQQCSQGRGQMLCLQERT